MLLRCECAPRGCSVKSNWKLIRTVGEMDAVRLRPWPSIWFRRHITCLQQIGSAGSKWRFSASHIRTHVHKQFQVSIANNCCFPKRDSNHLHSLCKAKTIPQSMTTKYDPTCTKRFKHCFKLLHNAQLLTFSYDDNAFFAPPCVLSSPSCHDDYYNNNNFSGLFFIIYIKMCYNFYFLWT